MRASEAKAGDDLRLFGVPHTVEHHEQVAEGQVRIGMRTRNTPASVEVVALVEVPPDFELQELAALDAAQPRDVEDIDDASYIIEHPALFDETEVAAARETLTKTSQFAAQD